MGTGHGITQPKYKNIINDVTLYVSTGMGHRIVQDDIQYIDTDSTTISLHAITEVPEGILEPDATIEEARDVLAGMVIEGDLEPGELEALLDVYPAWTEDTEYTIGSLTKHSGELYKVNQNHTSQAIYPPGSEGVSALYSRVVPDSVIPEWEQKEGSHDAYSKGDLVMFNGEVYESTINNNTWSPADYPAGWIKIG
ncbi:MAG: hypothetical protein RBR45_14150 [Pseudomonas sp.]|nr:hypothetical protein [Pseudomonas sp.]